MFYYSSCFGIERTSKTSFRLRQEEHLSIPEETETFNPGRSIFIKQARHSHLRGERGLVFIGHKGFTVGTINGFR